MPFDNPPEPTLIRRMPASALAAAISAREISCRTVMAAFLDRIEQANPLHNAIVSLRPRDELLAAADAADRALDAGASAGPLHGLPIAVKDLALTKGLRTTFGSPIFADFVPSEDEIIVERMRRAGAIVIGKTNTPEFGFGSQTYNPVFGATRNALDPALAAGGSSGGAAVALALDMVPLADGSDMCGSLRNPAGWNGVYGFRPSQGRVPAGPSTDLFMGQMGVEGPMARNVGDLALLLDVLSGYDARAPLSLADPPEPFAATLALPGAAPRVAWFGNLGGHLATETGVLDLCERALAGMGGAGWASEAHVPGFDFEALWKAFVTLRHATGGMALKPHYDDPAQRALLKPEAVWEVEGGLSLDAAAIRAASVVRSAWYMETLRLFERFDMLAMPSAQVFSFPVECHWPAEIAGRTMDSYHRWMEVTAPATMAGLPVACVPAGRDASGRAMGVQLIGRPRDDTGVLRAALAWETRIAAA